MQFALNEDQIAVRDMAREFAAEKIAPHAIRWDEEKHFPVDVMREAATLGIGGVYIRDDVGGLRRLRQNFPAIQRSQHGLDAARTNRVGLFRRADEARYLMSGGDEMRRDRSADIARCARAEDFHLSHRNPPPSLRA